MRRAALALGLCWAPGVYAQLSVLHVPSGAEPPAPIKLSLESATTTIECKERGAEILCELEARYVVRNIADHTESAWLFFSAPGYAKEIKMYEGPAMSPMKSVSDDLFDLANGFWRSEDLTGFFDTLQSGRTASTKGASLSVEAQQRVTITARCETAPIRKYSDWGRSVSLIKQRHQALAATWHDELSFHITPETALDWAVVGDSSFLLIVPARWEVAYDPDIPLYQREEDGKKQRILFSGLGPSDMFKVRFLAEPPLIQGGGAIFGMGASFTKDPFLFRTGYEAGTSRSFGPLLALLLETNFHSRAALVPQVGLGLADIEWSYLPNVSTVNLFLGAPLLIDRESTLQVGVRAQLDVTWGPLGLSLPVDFYPNSEDSPRVSILGQLTF